MRRILRRCLPKAEALRAGRAMRWLGPLLERPWLWSINRRGVAAGSAIGIFVGLVIPVAQIPLAALAAVALRANLPVAALCTFISNPVTLVPILLLAYHGGAWVLQVPPENAAVQELQSGGLQRAASLDYWIEHAPAFGAPLAAGLLLLAAVGAASAYLLVNTVWYALVYRSKPRLLAARNTLIGRRSGGPPDVPKPRSD